MTMQQPLTVDDVRRLCGDIPDWKISEILACGGDVAALERANAWSIGDNENTPDRNLEPGSPAARILEVLLADEEQDEWDARSGPA